MNFKIRKYKDCDIKEVCKIIIDTYSTCCRNECNKEGYNNYISYYKIEKDNLDKLQLKFKNQEIFYVVEKINKKNNKIVGFIRGSSNRLTNLYVLLKFQGFNLGKKLFLKFENKAMKLNTCGKIKINASLFAINFYKKFGYKKSTGIKNHKGLKFQPMIKYIKINKS